MVSQANVETELKIFKQIINNAAKKMCGVCLSECVKKQPGDPER